MTDGVTLMLGDCLDRMREIADGSVDLIAADLPYGVSACRWDLVIPFEPLWSHYRRVVKPRGVVVLTACQPFTSMLVMSNRDWFRYDIAWDKVGSTGFLDAKHRPLRRHESILVFSPTGRTTYNPQMSPGEPYRFALNGQSGVYGKHERVSSDNLGTRYPTSIHRASNANFKVKGKVHNTQKPVPLMEYLLKTYSDPGDLILDNTIGSGTTVIAAINTGRRVIGIEKDPDIFALASARILAHQASTPLLKGVAS